jgi:hypothetical protein
VKWPVGQAQICPRPVDGDGGLPASTASGTLIFFYNDTIAATSCLNRVFALNRRGEGA